jgi:hypothetical protein
MPVMDADAEVRDYVTVVATEVDAVMETNLRPAATFLADAYLQGGLREPGRVAGAFGVIEVAGVITTIMTTLIASLPLLRKLRTVLTNPDVTNMLTNLASLQALAGGLKGLFKGKPDPAPDILAVASSLERELDRAGVKGDQRDALVLRILRIILTAPGGTVAVAERLSAPRG